jgi:DUF4097 and DUF4098 domain-containing protein YvlB
VTIRKQFPVSGSTPSIEVRNAAGSVTVEARDGVEELQLEVAPLDRSAEQQLDRVGVHFSSSRLKVEVPERRLLNTPSFAISVITPPGADVRVATASAGTTLRGRLGRAELTSASGDVDVDECATLELRTASGDARVGTVAGQVRAASASGDLELGTAGDGLQFRTASGDVVVGDVAGDVTVKTASGDVQLDRVGEGAVEVKTVSGDSEVGVTPGLRVWLDLSSMSGRMESQLDDDGAAADGPAQLSLMMRSVSGDQRIRRVATAG